MKIHLGAGEDIRKEYINVDLYKTKGVDIVHNLNQFPYPFKENSVEEVIAYYIIEHLNDPYEVILELHRICKKDATIKIKVPHFSSGDTWNDLQHRKGFGTWAFNHPNILDKFDLIFQKITFAKHKCFMNWFANKFPGFYDYNLAYLFQASDLFIVLKVKK